MQVSVFIILEQRKSRTYACRSGYHFCTCFRAPLTRTAPLSYPKPDFDGGHLDYVRESFLGQKFEAEAQFAGETQAVQT